MSIGGICGKAESTNTSDCKNKCDIDGIDNANMVGGIAGYYKSENERQIINCVNER